MSYLEIKQLTKVIKGNTVLNKVDLELEKGQIYGFIGRNGSGKTMLFRAICGLIKPSDGSIIIDGEKINEDISFPRSVGVIIENPGFWSSYTAFENLKILSQIKKVINDNDILEALDKVGLGESAHVKYKKFSLGMKQKLAIVQAIMEKPDLLILDEPTNGLDEESCELVRDLLIKEKQRGATILIASHNSEDINKLADKKFKIDKGILTILDK